MKKIGIAAAILVVVIGIALAVVLGQLGRLIKSGVETYGPEITGTPVSLSSARVSIFSGQGELSRLAIDSPKGFTAGPAFELGRIAIAIDPKSVTGDVIHIRSLVVDGASLIAEFSAEGRNNLNDILQHAEGLAGHTAPAPPGKQGSGVQKRMIIDEFRFTNAEVRVVAAAFKLDRKLKIGDIDRRGLGGKQGATASDIAVQVLRPVVENAVRAAAQEYLKAKGGDLGRSLLDRLHK
jgi:hypothetical protein